MRAAATALVQDFNAAIAAAVGSFSGGSAFFLDMAAVYDAVYANPAAFGITNTTDACVIAGFFGQPQNVNTACGQSPAIQDTYLYFDEIHPSRVVHAAMGAAALAAVDEPAGAWLLGAAVAMAAIRWRRMAARR
jgi:outer membrane lipase/esterase